MKARLFPRAARRDEVMGLVHVGVVSRDRSLAGNEVAHQRLTYSIGVAELSYFGRICFDVVAVVAYVTLNPDHDTMSSHS